MIKPKSKKQIKSRQKRKRESAIGGHGASGADHDKAQPSVEDQALERPKRKKRADSPHTPDRVNKKLKLSESTIQLTHRPRTHSATPGTSTIPAQPDPNAESTVDKTSQRHAGSHIKEELDDDIQMSYEPTSPFRVHQPGILRPDEAVQAREPLVAKNRGPVSQGQRPGQNRYHTSRRSRGSVTQSSIQSYSANSVPRQQGASWSDRSREREFKCQGYSKWFRLSDNKHGLCVPRHCRRYFPRLIKATYSLLTLL